MLAILTIIAPLFIIILASAILRRMKLISGEWSPVLNELALKIGLPVLVFSALTKTPFVFSEQKTLLFSNSLLLIGSFLLTYILGKILRLNKKAFTTFFICLAFCNTAYLGIPVLVQIYGSGILSVASLIVAVHIFWMFTIGLGFLNYTQLSDSKNAIKTTLKNLFKNPLLIAVVLGILVASLKITLPAVIMKSLDMITASVTPTVLIVIGLFIGQSKIGKLKDWIPVFLFAVMTLIVLPGGFYLAVKFLGLSPHDFAPGIIQAAMPLAITPFALADKYNMDKEFIARSIVLSTILSIISLPFWISIL